MLKNILLCAFLIILLSLSLNAQGFDGASLAMGRAYGALATGIDAVAWNPANLILPRTGLLEVNIFSLNLNIANSGFSPEDYNRYFTQEGHNGEWSEDDINAILDLIGDDHLKIYGDVNSNALGVAFGNYAFAVQGIGNMYLTVPKTPIELFLLGNQDKDIIQEFDDVEGDGFGAVMVSLAFAYPISFKKYFKEFGVGINLNYYQGFEYYEINEGAGYFNTTTDEIRSKVYFKGHRADGGTGFGIDIGAAGIMDKKWTVSLALQNVFAGINWDDNPEIFRATAQIDSGDLKSPDEIKTTNIDTSHATDEFHRNIPVVFHLGAAYQFNDKLIFSADIEQAFGNTMGYSDQAVLSIGTQYTPIELIPLRAGFTLGGKWGFLFGLGFGIRAGVFQFDLAYSMHRALWPTLSKGNSLAIGTKLVF